MTRPSPARSPRREFDREAPDYDRTASASMPGYIDLHRTLLGGIPYVPTRGFRVLELGVGTGTLSSLVLEEFPHARLTGVDLSPRMIARARTKLRSFRSRVELIAGDIGDFEESPYDAVISALAIHHLTDPQKWRLFRRVYRCLPPGGYFGDADDHLAEDPTFDNRWAQIASTTAVGRRRGPEDGPVRRPCGTNTNDSTTRPPSSPRSPPSGEPDSRTLEFPGGSSGRPSFGRTSDAAGPRGRLVI